MRLPGFAVKGAFAWMSPVEQRKIAAYQSRSMAALNSLLHLIPLVGAITLIVLHWTKYWIGKPSVNPTTLQFVAKFHELLMQASLVDLLLYIIRSQALKSYVPLGALSGAARAPQLSYLWSLDFISAISAPTFNIWRRVVFAISTLMLLSMTATVGPSSAILMIPQAGMSKLSKTVLRYENVTESILFPTRMDKTSGLNL
jgi:hypothetical protein